VCGECSARQGWGQARRDIPPSFANCIIPYGVKRRGEKGRYLLGFYGGGDVADLRGVWGGRDRRQAPVLPDCGQERQAGMGMPALQNGDGRRAWKRPPYNGDGRRAYSRIPALSAGGGPSAERLGREAEACPTRWSVRRGGGRGWVGWGVW
jgi:hypothetical protein